jgi:hypothetical protein
MHLEELGKEGEECCLGVSKATWQGNPVIHEIWHGLKTALDTLLLTFV